MKTCHIFCAADFDGLLELPGSSDVILAADGGYRHLCALNLTPTGILGDFDSLGYVPKAEGVTLFPVEKDDTDSMLAIKQGLSMGCDRFLLYGALDGPRLDHTVANFQALHYLVSHGAYGYLIGRDYIVTAMGPGSLGFSPDAKGIISVFSLGSEAKGVSIRNLQYPLEHGTLTADFPLGVSNHFIGKPAEISLEAGALLILWDRANGLPTHRKGGNRHG